MHSVSTTTHTPRRSHRRKSRRKSYRSTVATEDTAWNKFDHNKQPTITAFSPGSDFMSPISSNFPTAPGSPGDGERQSSMPPITPAMTPFAATVDADGQVTLVHGGEGFSDQEDEEKAITVCNITPGGGINRASQSSTAKATPRRSFQRRKRFEVHTTSSEVQPTVHIPNVDIDNIAVEIPIHKEDSDRHSTSINPNQSQTQAQKQDKKRLNISKTGHESVLSTTDTLIVDHLSDIEHGNSSGGDDAYSSATGTGRGWTPSAPTARGYTPSAPTTHGTNTPATITPQGTPGPLSPNLKGMLSMTDEQWEKLQQKQDANARKRRSRRNSQIQRFAPIASPSRSRAVTVPGGGGGNKANNSTMTIIMDDKDLKESDEQQRYRHNDYGNSISTTITMISDINNQINMMGRSRTARHSEKTDESDKYKRTPPHPQTVGANRTMSFDFHDSSDDGISPQGRPHSLRLGSSSQHTITMTGDNDNDNDETRTEVDEITLCDDSLYNSNISREDGINGIRHIEPIQTGILASNFLQLDSARSSVIMASSPDIDIDSPNQSPNPRSKRSNTNNLERPSLSNDVSKSRSNSFVNFYRNRIMSKTKKNKENDTENNGKDRNDEMKEEKEEKEKDKFNNSDDDNKNSKNKGKFSLSNSPVKLGKKRIRHGGRKVRFGSNNIKTVINFISNSISINGEIVDDTTTTITPIKTEETHKIKHSLSSSASQIKLNGNENGNVNDNDNLTRRNESDKRGSATFSRPQSRSRSRSRSRASNRSDIDSSRNKDVEHDYSRTETDL